MRTTSTSTSELATLSPVAAGIPKAGHPFACTVDVDTACCGSRKFFDLLLQVL
jgi:hypothetical protein